MAKPDKIILDVTPDPTAKGRVEVQFADSGWSGQPGGPLHVSEISILVGSQGNRFATHPVTFLAAASAAARGRIFDC